MKLATLLCIIALLVAMPFMVEAAGKHEGLSCVGCHGIHDAKGDIIFSVAPNKKSINPKTKQPYSGVTALCLGCHETMDKGGMGILPISSAMSHPFGITPNPKIATVPSLFLRDGKLECVGCHDPHPSNPNYKYLRVDTKNGSEMQNFCGMCHASKSDKRPKVLDVFSSMDETKAGK